MKKFFITNGSIEVTPEMATWILEQCRFEGQRKEYHHQVDLLAATMKAGEWLSDDQLSFCVLPDGTIILVNGYHRMKAVEKSGIPVRFHTRVIPVKDIDEVRKVYNKFDTATRNRSTAEILNAAGIYEKWNVSKQVGTAVYKAAPLIANNFKMVNYQNMPPALRSVVSRIQTADEFASLAKDFEECLSPATYKYKYRLLNVGITAVALATLGSQRDKAMAFWSGVTSMNNLDYNDPRMTLAKHISNVMARTNTPDGEVPKSCVAAALAWNAFFNGIGLTILRTSSSFSLAGTRWK